MQPYAVLTSILAAFVAISSYSYSPFTNAAMQPIDLENVANALATSSFAVKDLILAINSSKNPAALPDVFDEFDDLFDTLLADIGLLPGTAVLSNGNDEQLVFEAYSNFVQGLFEFMDAITSSATTLIELDPQNEFRIPCAIRQLSGVVDAFFFNVIALFPSNTSFAFQTSNQKGQVDTHFTQAIAAVHLATAKTPVPYSNTTDPVPAARKSKRSHA